MFATLSPMPHQHRDNDNSKESIMVVQLLPSRVVVEDSATIALRKRH